MVAGLRGVGTCSTNWRYAIMYRGCRLCYSLKKFKEVRTGRLYGDENEHSSVRLFVVYGLAESHHFGF